MSKRRATILLIVLLIFIIALLSVAAYTVKTQNLSNTTAAIMTQQPSDAVLPTYADTDPIPSDMQTAPTGTQDAVNTDISSVQYKTVAGNGFTVEVPLAWNNFEETTGGCASESIVNGDAKISIWPNTCTIAGTYTHTTPVQGYVVASNYSDQDIASKAVYEHIIATFTIVQ